MAKRKKLIPFANAGESMYMVAPEGANTQDPKTLASVVNFAGETPNVGHAQMIGAHYKFADWYRYTPTKADAAPGGLIDRINALPDEPARDLNPTPTQTVLTQHVGPEGEVVEEYIDLD